MARVLGWEAEEVLAVEALTVHIHSIDADSEDRAPMALPEETDTEKELLNKDLAHTIQRCLEAISDNEQRLAFIMKHRHDKTLAQIAEHFGFAIQTAANRVETARKSMAVCLETSGWTLND